LNTYALHLALINQTQRVSASCHIFNSKGRIILKSGAEFDHEAAKVLSENALPKSLEYFVKIENEFDADQLTSVFKGYLRLDPSYCELYEQQEIDEDIERCCANICRLDIIPQRLTALSILFPQVFDQALFSAWMILTLLQRSGAEDKAKQAAFSAALCQNIGYMDIAPDIVRKEDEFSDEDERLIQSHPNLGYQILSTITGISKETARAVQEHHECMDGSGFPARKVGKQLSWAGQTINLLDSIHAIYQRHFKPRKLTLRDTVPIIQMNMLARHGSSVSDLIAFLEPGSRTEQCTVSEEDVPNFVKQLKHQHKNVLHFIEITQTFLADVGVRHDNARLYAIQNIALHIYASMSQAEMINEGYMRWLDQVITNKLTHAYRELEDVFLMMQELLFHIERFRSQIYPMEKRNTNPKLREPLAKLVSQLEELPKPESQNYTPLVITNKPEKT